MNAHLSENQEDKLVPLRMLHEGLYIYTRVCLLHQQTLGAMVVLW